MEVQNVQTIRFYTLHNMSSCLFLTQHELMYNVHPPCSNSLFLTFRHDPPQSLSRDPRYQRTGPKSSASGIQYSNIPTINFLSFFFPIPPHFPNLPTISTMTSLVHPWASRSLPVVIIWTSKNILPQMAGRIFLVLTSPKRKEEINIFP